MHALIDIAAKMKRKHLINAEIFIYIDVIHKDKQK